MGSRQRVPHAQQAQPSRTPRSTGARGCSSATHGGPPSATAPPPPPRCSLHLGGGRVVCTCDGRRRTCHASSHSRKAIAASCTRQRQIAPDSMCMRMPHCCLLALNAKRGRWWLEHTGRSLSVRMGRMPQTTFSEVPESSPHQKSGSPYVRHADAQRSFAALAHAVMMAQMQRGLCASPTLPCKFAWPQRHS